MAPARATIEGSDLQLPVNPALSQKDLGELLGRMHDTEGCLHTPLAALESWSQAVGYFDHLQCSNELITLKSAAAGVDLRLQVNYSRQGYKPPQSAHADTAEKSAHLCPLCFANVASKAKPLLRALVLSLSAGKITHFAHLTPFPLCHGHFVVNRIRHEPMRIDEAALSDAICFSEKVPGWLIASNSDVEWAGASVLVHHHFQAFRDYTLPVECAAVSEEYCSSNGITVSTVAWPAAVIRLQGPTRGVLKWASRILNTWKQTDPGKATCNFLVRVLNSESSVFHMFLRHPDYRTRGSAREIKAEGVGIIEMAGEVIVPPLPALTREENHAYFVAHGQEITQSIIMMNSPAESSKEAEALCNHLIAQTRRQC